jgi:hypothetical protein
MLRTRLGRSPLVDPRPPSSYLSILRHEHGSFDHMIELANVSGETVL